MEDAAEVYRKGAALATEFLDRNPKGILERRTYRSASQLVGAFLEAKEAEAFLKRAIEISADLVEEFPGVKEYVLNLEMAVHHLEMHYFGLERYDDALEGIKREDALRRNLGLQPKVNALSRRALILNQQGKTIEAVRSYEQSIERLSQSVHNETASEAIYQWLIAAHYGLADVLEKQGNMKWLQNTPLKLRPLNAFSPTERTEVVARESDGTVSNE